MTNEEILHDFTLLPPEGQRQVANLIAYLRQRYLNGESQPRPQSQLRDWSEEEFVGMWRDREEMKDSVAWVRALRQSEEAR
ncbi:MAG: hypothetical protein AAB401_04320 [Acidobacteriota bacterium]